MFLPDLRLEVAFNSGARTPIASRVWTDISDYALLDRGITITGGRTTEQSVTDANNLTVTLDNTDGRFTPEKSGSPYFPNVKVGRPIRMRANVLTNGNRGTFDVDINGWVGSSATLARVTSPVQAGAGALQLTATAATTINAAASNTGGSLVDDVVPLETYTAEAWIRRNGGTSRNARVDIEWYTSGGALISTTTGTSVALTTSYALFTTAAAAPATAAFARVLVVVISVANGEVFHADSVALLSDRFLGFVDEWPVEWDDGGADAASSVITASSRLALLGEGEQLDSIIEEELDIDAPTAYYTLGEASGATQARDSSGNNQTALTIAKTVTTTASPADPQFGNATGPGVDSLTAATFLQGGRYLSAQLPVPAGDFTIEAFFIVTGTGFDMLGFGEVWAGVDTSAHHAYIASPANLGGVYGTSAPDDGLLHHMAVRWKNSTTKIDLFIDGSLEATITDAGVIADGVFTVGNNTRANGPGARPPANVNFAGTVAHAAVFSTALSNGRIASHASAGVGFAGDLASARLNRYMTYAGLTSSDLSANTGDTPLANIDTTDKTVLEAMRVVETTDGGVLYDRRDGLLGYADKGTRYQAASAFTLDVAAQQLSAGVRPILDRSALINDVTASNLTDTLGAHVNNPTSIVDHGKRNLDLELATDDSSLPFQSASNVVNRYSTPHVRVPTFAPVDILTLPDALMAAVMAADVGTRFTVSNQPAQAPAATTDYFVEGYTDTITTESWVRTFNVSAAALFNVWLLDSGTRSQLDQTTILGL